VQYLAQVAQVTLMEELKASANERRAEQQRRAA
jgi:hypothetical protein